MDSLRIVITLLAISARFKLSASFTCKNKALGQYCMKDLTGYYECKIILKTNLKKYIIHRCRDGTRCSCDSTTNCTMKQCTTLSQLPRNRREYMALSFIGSDFVWDNGKSYEEKLKGEIYEDAVKKLFIKKQQKVGKHTKWEMDRFELILPDIRVNGTFIKYYGKKKIYPPDNSINNATRIYRECHKAKMKEFPSFLDLRRFTLVNSRVINENSTLQTWSFRSNRQHRTTDQVRTTWKVLYDARREYIFPKKYRDVKKSMPGPRLTPNQRGEIRNLVFKEGGYDTSKRRRDVFSLPDYCKDITIYPNIEGFIE